MTIHYERDGVTLHLGDCRESMRQMKPESVQCCITSPPYFGLRDYQAEGQLGIESTPDEYVANLVDVFREVRRALRMDGTLWLNLGDSYASTTKGSGGTGASGLMRDGRNEARRTVTADASNSRAKFDVRHFDLMASGLKPKDLIGIPWRVAFALQDDGWTLRQDIIWHKPNPMPESVRDRCTKAHEYLFLLSKRERYFFDADAISERGAGREVFGNKRSKGDCEDRNDNDRRDMTLTEYRNRRSVWTVATQTFSGAHFATFPPKLIEPCVLAGSRAGDLILDPFNGAGTTGLVARKHGRNYVGCDVNAAYLDMSAERIAQGTAQGDMFRGAA